MSRTILKKLSAALLFAAIALLPSTAAMQQKGGEEEIRSVRRRRELAAALGEAGLHLGIAAGHLRRVAEPDLHRRTRRAEAARQAAARLQRHLGIARRACDDADGRDAQLPARRRRRAASLSSRGPSGTSSSRRQRDGRRSAQGRRSARTIRSATSGWSTTRVT